MICYHTTYAGDAIQRDGFRDATGSYLFANIELTGVWLGDSPMDINEGAAGDQVLRVEFPDDVDLSEYEIVEDAKPTALCPVDGPCFAWVLSARARRHVTDPTSVTLLNGGWPGRS